MRAHWVELLGRYLGERQSLIGLLLIMDARHPLKDLDLSKWSFTFDDSMANFFAREGKSFFRSDEHPLHGTVMDAGKMVKAIAQYGTNLPDGTPRTFEAQYWSEAPLKGEVVPGRSPATPKADEYGRDKPAAEPLAPAIKPEARVRP